MTVTTNTNKVQALGNGATKTFPYSFRIYSASELVVTSTNLDTGVDTTLVLNTDYTVTGAGSYNGGNVVLTGDAPSSTTRITIRRVIPVTQGTDLRNQGAYFAETHEDVFDKLTMIDQQQQEAIDRSLVLPASSSGVSTELPLPSGSKVIGWNEAGDALQNYGAVDNTLLAVQLAATTAGLGASMIGIQDAAGNFAAENVEAALAEIPADMAASSGSSLVGFIHSATGAVARTAQSKLRETVSAEDFGAVGDGVADDLAKLQAAIDWLASVGGGRLLLTRGKTYGITGTLYVKSNVRLVGDGLPKIKAISVFQGAMVQFGFTTGTIGPLEVPTNPCIGAEINGIEVDGDYKAQIRNYAAGIDSGLVHVWLYCKRNKVINCSIHSAEQGLVEVEDVADFFELSGCDIYDATTFSAATQFINLVNIDGPEHASIVGNKCYDLKQSGYAPASWGYALRLHATDHALVRGNSFSAGWTGVFIDGRSNLITNNRIAGAASRGIYLAENEFFCRFNSVVHNYVDGNGVTGIQEQNAANVERNYIAYNTVRNSNNPLQVPLKNSIVHGNQVYDVGGTIQPEITRFNIDKGATVDASSNLASGTWTPTTIDNITNLSGTAITDAQYARVGNIVYFSGKASTTIAAAGAYEFRFTMPIDSVFSADTDANGTASDSYSAYGLVAALTTGTPRRIRVQGSATSAGAKTIRFTGSYIIK